MQSDTDMNTQLEVHHWPSEFSPDFYCKGMTISFHSRKNDLIGREIRLKKLHKYVL
jgi:hypothetical protein